MNTTFWFDWRHCGVTHAGNIVSVEHETEDHLIARYETPAIKGVVQPLIKFHKHKNLCYFLTEEAMTTGEIAFQTQGVKANVCNDMREKHGFTQPWKW